MSTKELLSTISSLSSKPVYIVGGVPRDKVLNKIQKITDIDLTTGNNSIKQLESEMKIKFPTANYKSFKDGHSQFIIDGIKIDLSSNFRYPEIKQLLQKAGINNPTDLQCELFSRDFTCNTLLLTTDLKKIYDVTGYAIKDINNKLLRTCLPAALTLGIQNKRVVRIIYLAAKLGFDVDNDIINFVKSNPQTFINANKGYLTDKIKKSLVYDRERTLNLINEMGIKSYIPVIPELL